MNELFAPGHVVSLHLHSVESNAAMQPVETIEVEAGKGIIGNPRYFARRSRGGGISKRHVSLIEREQIAQHARAIGWEKISPGLVRSNIETVGVNLISLVGQSVHIGTALLHFYEARTPCWKMDKIYYGLRELMTENRQGVLAQVMRSGKIRVGDEIFLAREPTAHQSVGS